KYLFDTSSIFEAIKKNKVNILIDNYTVAYTKIELGNVIRKQFIKKEMSKEEAIKIFEKLIEEILNKEMIVIDISDTDLSEILKLSIETNISFYDACFVYYSKRLNAVFVTEDEKLKNVLRGFVDVKSLEEIV
ncbi:MAG: type II toxin-antitoxin system VapC family toxin, partial [Candidatus Aenigmatarchaeota archaeon]